MRNSTRKESEKPRRNARNKKIMSQIKKALDCIATRLVQAEKRLSGVEDEIEEMLPSDRNKKKVKQA
jgi:hypothetical protein